MKLQEYVYAAAAILLVTLVVMLFVAGKPAKAQDLYKCEPLEDVLPRFGEHTAKPVNGVAFDLFIERLIANFGPHPSGRIPNSGVVIEREDDELLYLLMMFDDCAHGQFYTHKSSSWATDVLGLLGDAV